MCMLNLYVIDIVKFLCDKKAYKTWIILSQHFVAQKEMASELETNIDHAIWFFVLLVDVSS